MSDTLLSDLPQTICNQIDAALPALKVCKPTAGKFSLDELNRTGVSAPAVLVSILGAVQSESYAGGFHTYTLKMAAYVVTRDTLGTQRDQYAANICQRLLSMIPETDWGMGALGAAANVTMQTLVSAKSKDHAVSLWAVTWDQVITFTDRPDSPLGVELYTTLGNQTYEQIGAGS